MIEKTFFDPTLRFIEFKVTILNDTVFITKINKLNNEHSSIEVPHEVFEKIIELLEEVDSDG